MASVFKAHDPDLNRDVAVKVLPSHHTDESSFLKQFRREAQGVARLNHPNIVQIYDFGQDKGFTYIVMAYASGGTLQDRLAWSAPSHTSLGFGLHCGRGTGIHPQGRYSPQGHQA